MQHRFSSGMNPQEYLTKTGTASSSRFNPTFHRVNLSLTGCSSAEPASISVQHKILNNELYLQPAKFSSHFPLDFMECISFIKKPWGFAYYFLLSIVLSFKRVQKEETINSTPDRYRDFCISICHGGFVRQTIR